MKWSSSLVLVLLVVFALPLTLHAEDTTPTETEIVSGLSGEVNYRDMTFEWTGSVDVTAIEELICCYRLKEDNEGLTSPAQGGEMGKEDEKSEGSNTNTRSITSYAGYRVPREIREKLETLNEDRTLTDTWKDFVDRLAEVDTPRLVDKDVLSKIEAIVEDGKITEEDIDYVKELAENHPKKFLEVRGDDLYFDGKRYVMKGFNYFPRDHGWKIFKTDEFDPDQIQKELELGRELGAEVVRTFVNWRRSFEPLFGESQIYEEYIKNVEKFLTIAAREGYRVYLSLFTLPTRRAYVDQDSYREYLEDLIPRFKHDSRILAWDITNEPTTYYDFAGEDNVDNFLKDAISITRKLDNNHPISIGGISPLELSFPAIGQHKIPSEVIEKVDMVDVHYPPNFRMTDIMDEVDKPVIVGEFGTYTFEDGSYQPKTEKAQKEYYMDFFEAAASADIDGALFWTLMDFPPGSAYGGEKGETVQDHHGVIRTDYTKKPAVDVIEEYFKEDEWEIEKERWGVESSKTLTLEFGQTVPESNLNPAVEDGRDLTFSLFHITIRNEKREEVLDINVGGNEEDIFFKKGMYYKERPGERRLRWLGRTSTTVLEVPTLPESGFVELTGRGAANMEVKVIFDDEVKGVGRIGTRHDTYRIDYG